MRTRSRLIICIVLVLLSLLWFTEQKRIKTLVSTRTTRKPRPRWTGDDDTDIQNSFISTNDTTDTHHDHPIKLIPTLHSPPPSSPTSRVLLTATGDNEYIAWSRKYLSNWHHVTYSPSLYPDPALHHLPNPGLGHRLKAHEATALLTYIISNYPSTLPAYLAFIRPKRSNLHHGTHFDHANAVALHAVNFTHLDARGFFNLRCSRYPGCDPPLVAPPPWHARNRVPKKGVHQTWQHRMPQLWPRLFGQRATYPAGDTIATPSGGEFVVTHEKILLREKWEYEKLLAFIQDGGAGAGAGLSSGGIGGDGDGGPGGELYIELDDRETTELFDGIWHVVFGMPAVHCLDEYTCACEQFNRCSE